MECIKTEVKHSLSKTAWNVVGTQFGRKYKIARVPYLVIEGNEILTTRNKHEALEHALFISRCFNEKQDGREDQIDRSSYLVGYLHALKIANRAYNKSAKNTEQQAQATLEER